MKIFITTIYLSFSLFFVFAGETNNAHQSLEKAKESSSIENQIFLSNEALLQCKLPEDLFLQADIYNFRGSVYQNIGDLGNALEDFLRAYDIYKSSENSDGLANTLNNLGVFYAKTNDTEKALSYFKEALVIKQDLFKKNSNNQIQIYIGGSYNNIGLIYDIQNNVDSSICYFKKSIALRNQLNDIPGLIDSYTNIAITYLNMSSFQLSENYLMKADSLSSYIENTETSINTSYNLADFYFHIGKTVKAEKYLKKSMLLAEKGNYGDLLASIYSLKSEISALKRDYEKALYYQSRFYQINDSLLSKQTMEHIDQLMVNHDVQRKEERIEFLTEEQRLTDQRMKFIKISFFILLIILLFTVIIIFIIFRQKTNILYKNRELVKRNIELAKQDAKKVLPTQSQMKKYATSALSDEKKQLVFLSLTKILEEQKVYLQKDITIEIVATMMDINRTYLSQIVNEKFDSNFTLLINKYRINHAIALLSNSENFKYSIAGIAEMSGFKSISSFNTIFKQRTGLTPSVFRKTYREK